MCVRIVFVRTPVRLPVTHQALVSELDMAEFYVHAIAHCILMKLSHIIKVWEKVSAVGNCHYLFPVWCCSSWHGWLFAHRITRRGPFCTNTIGFMICLLFKGQPKWHFYLFTTERLKNKLNNINYDNKRKWLFR